MCNISNYLFHYWLIAVRCLQPCHVCPDLLPHCLLRAASSSCRLLPLRGNGKGWLPRASGSAALAPGDLRREGGDLRRAPGGEIQPLVLLLHNTHCPRYNSHVAFLGHHITNISGELCNLPQQYIQTFLNAWLSCCLPASRIFTGSLLWCWCIPWGCTHVATQPKAGKTLLFQVELITGFWLKHAFSFFLKKTLSHKNLNFPFKWIDFEGKVSQMGWSFCI